MGTVTILTPALRDAYLRRLGLPAPQAPTLDALRELHRAHVERIAYESLWIALGERRTIEPLDSVRYLVGGRGGYCYHLNGGFAALLTTLGFQAHWRIGGVQMTAADAPGPSRNHAPIEVTGLDGSWLVDVGLGDGLHDPLPLVAGSYRQDPLTFELRPSAAIAGGWRLDHDPTGSFVGMDFGPGPAEPADFAASHTTLSTSPDSGFVRTVAVLCRRAGAVDDLRGLVLRSTGSALTTLATRRDYFAALADVFHLDLSDVDDDRRAALWTRLCADHDAYLARTQ